MREEYLRRNQDNKEKVLRIMYPLNTYLNNANMAP